MSWIVSRIWDWCLFQMFYIKTESLRTNYLYRKWSQILLSRHNTQSLTRGKAREKVSCCQKSLQEFLFARKMIQVTQFYNHDQNYPILFPEFIPHTSCWIVYWLNLYHVCEDIWSIGLWTLVVTRILEFHRQNPKSALTTFHFILLSIFINKL